MANSKGVFGFAQSLKKLQSGYRALNSCREVSLDDFIEDHPAIREAIEDGFVQLSTQGGDIFFHMSKKGLIRWERAFSELKAWVGIEPGPDDFNPALSDDHPHNVAWSERAFREQEAHIAKLKAHPAAIDAQRSFSSTAPLNSRISRIGPRL